ncbi:fructosamine kinase family protein [Spirulina major]|uniref:fructosamine kinase family protein n=1 Tax=Spirulina major TaxID=270636 RepID=UPI00093523B3|nr:fructosamine kinase family protein [Spirulina major]
MWDQIAQQITTWTDQPFTIQDRQSVGGGCINQGYRVSDGDRSYFIKLNAAHQEAMFQAEALALRQMATTHTIRVPHPIGVGVAERSSYIVMEWLNFGRGASQSWAQMGRDLAALHQATGSNQFGWDQNNTIGSTPQVNTWTDSWADFFAEHRIGFQLRLAQRRGGSFPATATVIAKVRDLLAAHHPQPALVHGDLWSGNAACTVDGVPVILDPALYWGDRETDIAMTELFGGFPAAFYSGYEALFPLDSGYPQRKKLYNLYHILNHFNLFGGGYGGQAARMIDQL